MPRHLDEPVFMRQRRGDINAVEHDGVFGATIWGPWLSCLTYSLMFLLLCKLSCLLVTLGQACIAMLLNKSRCGISLALLPIQALPSFGYQVSLRVKRFVLNVSRVQLGCLNYTDYEKDDRNVGDSLAR